MKKRFNIHGVFRASAQSGVDIPAERIYKNTVVDASYDTFGSGAYPTVFDNKAMRDIAGKVPHDHVIVLTGVIPKNWSTFSESIIDKFSILSTLNLGGYTYEEALQWTPNRVKIKAGRCINWSGQNRPRGL